MAVRHEIRTQPTKQALAVIYCRMEKIASLTVPALDGPSQVHGIAIHGDRLLAGFKGPVGDGKHGGFVLWDMTDRKSAAQVGEPRHCKKPWVTVSAVGFCGDAPVLSSARGIYAVDPNSDDYDTLSSVYGCEKLCGFDSGILGFDGRALYVVDRSGNERKLHVSTNRGESMARPTVSKDGRFFAAPCRDGMFRVVNLADGEVPFKKKGRLVTPAFDAQTQHIAYVTDDNQMRILDTQEWSEQHVLDGLKGVSSLAFSSDGTHVFGLASHLGGQRASELHMWELASGRKRTWTAPDKIDWASFAVASNWLAIAPLEESQVSILSY